MYTKRNYGFWMTFNWSKKPFIYGLFYSFAIILICHLAITFFEVNLVLPWQPISVLGISVAFYLGFKNNSSYDRLWESRKIWGAIVNSSRSFGSGICSFVSGEGEEKVKRTLIYRHIAWLKTLCFQLRLSRPWEHGEDRIKDEYPKKIDRNYVIQLEKEIGDYISKEEFEGYMNKSNIAIQLLNTQTLALQELRNKNYIEDFKHMELFQSLKVFIDEQGKSERIKNFPFPRQYASVAYWSALLFAALIPFGMFDIFKGSGNYLISLSVPLSALLIWIFFLMEKIGDYSENPFEGTYNDIPITALSRTIEIDLREMINDTEIPGPILADENGYLM